MSNKPGPVSQHDHPDHCMIWAECELRWIAKRDAQWWAHYETRLMERRDELVKQAQEYLALQEQANMLRSWVVHLLDPECPEEFREGIRKDMQ